MIRTKDLIFKSNGRQRYVEKIINLSQKVIIKIQRRTAEIQKIGREIHRCR